MGDFKFHNKVYTVDEFYIKQNMEELGVDRLSAVRAYFEDSDMIKPGCKDVITEVAPTKAKRNYTKSDKPRKKAEKVRKVDEEKKEILSAIRVLMEGKSATITEIKNEAEISFTFRDNSYTLKLVKHRPPKEGAGD